MSDEAKLFETLRKIEALFAGATTPGEREAAGAARERIAARLKAAARVELPKEFRFSMHDTWSRKLFCALLRRYGLTPYRYYGQRRTTVMVKAQQSFVDETLWPEYQQIDETLRLHLEEITDRIIARAIHDDASDAAEVSEPKRLQGDG